VTEVTENPGIGDPAELLRATFGRAGDIAVVSAPGRVNLIGEHIDYHGLPVLPIALDRRIALAWRARPDRRIRAVSGVQYGIREFEWVADLAPVAAGDWENYLRAAARAVGAQWSVGRGIDAAIVSDLPPAAGLSSSSALIVAFTLGLLRANGYNPGFEELMEVLPEGEHFVGTRGGGMDHAASLASQPGCASRIGFDPLTIRHIPIPADWGFLVAHSGVTAEKSGGAREEYNARRKAGSAALGRLGLSSYKEAVPAMAARLTCERERDAFLHVTTEAARVEAAVGAMTAGDAAAFGRLLLESHASLRDRLRISCAALDRLVENAMELGAQGARLTGGGFGGCAVVFAGRPRLERIRRGLQSPLVIEAEPSAGALYRTEI
jgi:galactokinase